MTPAIGHQSVVVRWLALTGFLVGALMAVSVHATSPRAGLITGNSLQVGGLVRTYDLFVPANLGPTPRPLVLLLHGHMGDAAVMTGENRKKAPYKRWLEIAEREKLIVVIPDGEKGSDGWRGWNDCRSDAATNPVSDDVAFIDALLDAVAAKYAVDPKRCYATGTSNGGNMVFRLALEMPERFAAVAPIVASMPKHSTCRPRPVITPILIMNGTKDPLLPYAGGRVGKRDRDQRGEVLSTRDSVSFWVRHNQAEIQPVVRDPPDRDRRDDSTVHVEHHRAAPGGAEVVLYEIRGGGHTEPSLTEHYSALYRRIVGPQNRDIEMAEEVWQFFRTRSR